MEEKEPDDSVIKTRADFNQAGAAMKEYAPLVWSFFRALREQGFSPHEALELAREFMIRTMFTK